MPWLSRSPRIPAPAPVPYSSIRHGGGSFCPFPGRGAGDHGSTHIPEIIGGAYNVQQFAFGGTSLLIVVSVTMDTVAQIQSHLIAQQYEGLIRKARLKGARVK